LAPAAHAAEIASLSCVASNGVLLKSEAAANGALTVKSQWGVYEKEFTATVATTSDAHTINVNLASKDGQSYVLSLAAPTVRKQGEPSTVSGTILQPSQNRGQQPAIVAYVRCDLRLR
ncbi:MAG: hypothetical protein ACXWP1_11070, partial [Bdellovibrionota bacterium]